DLDDLRRSRSRGAGRTAALRSSPPDRPAAGLSAPRTRQERVSLMARSRDVLVVGFDPRAVPGVDPEAVEVALAVGRENLAQHGLNADECLAALDDTFEATVVESLTRKPYGCVV